MSSLLVLKQCHYQMGNVVCACTNQWKYHQMPKLCYDELSISSFNSYFKFISNDLCKVLVEDCCWLSDIMIEDRGLSIIIHFVALVVNYIYAIEKCSPLFLFLSSLISSADVSSLSRYSILPCMFGNCDEIFD